jgi:hypothetical protein
MLSPSITGTTSPAAACGGRWGGTGSPPGKSAIACGAQMLWGACRIGGRSLFATHRPTPTSSRSLQRVLFAERDDASGHKGRKRRSAARSGTGRPAGVSPGPETQYRLRCRDEGNGKRWGSLQVTRRFGTVGRSDYGPARNPPHTSSEELARTDGARSARRWRSVRSCKG